MVGKGGRPDLGTLEAGLGEVGVTGEKSVGNNFQHFLFCFVFPL